MPRELPQRELAQGFEDGASAKGGVSALRIVLVGALVAFGGYSAVAGASMFLGRSPDGEVQQATAKSDVDCASSRFAWRPECREAEKAESASSEDDKSRRTRRRSTASAAASAEPVASPTIAQLAAAAVAEPLVAAEKPEPGPAPTAAPSIERRLTKRPEPAGVHRGRGAGGRHRDGPRAEPVRSESLAPCRKRSHELGGGRDGPRRHGFDQDGQVQGRRAREAGRSARPARQAGAPGRGAVRLASERARGSAQSAALGMGGCRRSGCR